MIVFAQYNANAAGGNPQSADMELRGTKGTMYIHSNRMGGNTGESHGNVDSPARTPLDRNYRKNVRAIAKNSNRTPPRQRVVSTPLSTPAISWTA